MEKDLKHIINEDSGFKTPPSYFDTLEDQIMNRLKLEQDGIKKNPFVVPDNYFSTLEETIAEKTFQNTNRKPKVLSLTNRNFLKYAASIAAVFILILSVYHFQTTPYINEEGDFTSVTEYIENDGIDFSSFDLQELLSDEVLDHSFPESDISHEALLEYLSYNIDETAFLNN